jgi:hypothetical protein
MSIKNSIVRTLVIILLLITLALIGCGPATESGINSNLGPKDVEDPASGGFVWGQNDKKTGLPEEEMTNEAIIKRQKEVLKRQELEKERLEKEKQDILRQQYYNEQLKAL